jgi:hypothetical protein
MMSESNSAIIRKAYEDFAQENVALVFAALDPAITGTFPGIVQYQGISQATSRSELSFDARWNFQEARSASTCTTYLLMTTSSSRWSPSRRNETRFPHHFLKCTSGE